MWGPQGGGRGSGVLAHYTPPSPPFFDSSDVPAAADTGSGRPGFFYFLFLFLTFFYFSLVSGWPVLRFLAKKCVAWYTIIIVSFSFVLGSHFNISRPARLRTRSPL